MLLLRFIFVPPYTLEEWEVKAVVVDINSDHAFQNSELNWPIFYEEAISQKFVYNRHFIQRCKNECFPLIVKEYIILEK